MIASECRTLKTIAVLCYVVALAGLAALTGQLLLLGHGCNLWQPNEAVWQAALIDVAWLSVFGIQHSGMARAGFKRWLTRILPACLERSVFVAVSGLIALGMALTWQPLPGEPFWRGPSWLSAVPLLAVIGIGLVFQTFDHATFFGLRQVWQRDTASPPEHLRVAGPYRYVRHPLMTGLLVLLWAHPVMTPALALLSGGLSMYVGIGVCFEERDLVCRFGPAYEAYRRSVPALLPWRAPAPAGTYPAISEG